MCELGFFPIFLENELLKVDKILGSTFSSSGKKRLERGTAWRADVYFLAPSIYNILFLFAFLLLDFFFVLA